MKSKPTSEREAYVYIQLPGTLETDFRLNAEVSVVCYDEAVSSQLRAEAERTMRKAEALTMVTWARRSWVRQGAQNLARLVSPLL